MTTTQTESSKPDSTTTDRKATTRADRVFESLGLALSLVTFALGAYVMLPTLPLLFLGARPARRFGRGLLLGSLGCLLLSGLGLNPVIRLARETALDRIEQALGSRPTFSDFSGSAVAGRLQFSGISCAIPDVGGHLSLEDLEIQTGPAFWPWSTTTIRARGLRVDIEPQGDGLSRWAKRISGQNQTPFEAEVVEATLRVNGPQISAQAHANKAIATSSSEGMQLVAAPDLFDLTVNKATHSMLVLGNVTISRSASGFGLHCDLRFAHEQIGHGLARGELRPDFKEPGLVLTLDDFNIEPIHARYAQWSEFKGKGRGVIAVAGNFDELVLKHHISLTDLEYFHTTAMKLDRSRRFCAALAEIEGELAVLGGSEFEFRKVVVSSGDCTLATDPAMNARGPVRIEANGRWPNIEGHVDVTVREGNVVGPLEFTRTGRSLKEYEPNCVPLVELLPAFSMTLALKVEKVGLSCDPLTGTLSGDLTGTLNKKAGESYVSVRLQGELPLSNGHFDFCAASGSAEGKLIFSPLVPPRETSLRGKLSGKAGETALEIEVTGSLSGPGLIFKRVTMKPESLGRMIFNGGKDLPAALEMERMAIVSRMCGIHAATQRNPFEVSSLGEIFFDFRPGD